MPATQGGDQTGQYVLLLAVMAGVCTLVPTVGPIVGAIVGTLIGLTFSLQVGLLVLIASSWHNCWSGGSSRRASSAAWSISTPRFLVMAITALSQFGLIWVFVAAPLVAVARELFRYVYGRVADPPLPAGVLPGEGDGPRRRRTQPAAAPRRVPLVYRRGRGDSSRPERR